MNFLKYHNVFTNSQFGFRQKHITIHALLNFVDKVTHAIDNYSHLIGIFLDFSKAFDTINHNILLHKLSHYGIYAGRPWSGSGTTLTIENSMFP